MLKICGLGILLVGILIGVVCVLFVLGIGKLKKNGSNNG